MIKNIVFDIGNVLTDYRWREFLQEKGYDREMVERIARASVAGPYWKEMDRGVWDRETLMGKFISIDPAIEEALRHAFADIRGLVTPRAYAIPWVESLRAKGYGVYYLSNFSQVAFEECADALAFLPYMDGGVLSFQEKLVKPEPAIYRLLLARYGLEACQCVFLDDLEENVEAARQQGFAGIVFETKEQAQRELLRLGVGKTQTP